MSSDVEKIHIRDEDGATLCGSDGQSITKDEAFDPDDGKDFTCGACWKALAGGTEPMGGTRP